MPWQAVKDTVFAGTNRGLYRLNSGVWEQLSVGVSEAIHSLEVFENNLYIKTGPDLLARTKDHNGNRERQQREFMSYFPLNRLGSIVDGYNV